jgi:acyl transferase domain-containing protein/phosphopantetheinyl transferase/acyl carrier protein
MEISEKSQPGIAIVGMACIFPGAPDAKTYWRNIVSKVDAVSDPPGDWGAEIFYQPNSTESNRVYCKRGGYLHDLAAFDPLQYGVMPSSIDGGEPDHFLALRVAHEAMADAGYCGEGARPIPSDRVEVIFGRGAYINRGFTNLVQHALMIDQTLQLLRQLHPEHTEDELAEIRRELIASLPPFNAEMAPGLVPNILSGRIANRLDFMGPNFTVDAACASSLIAVDRGVQDLVAKRCDLALVGGIHCSTPAPIFMVFCQLNALSRQGCIKPFSEDADGTLLGEGLGMLVLKRAEDAHRDGDRVYAVIKAVGSASDGRALGLLAPRVEGEELAMRRAYQTSGVEPSTVGLLEAHGTGTLIGDQTEFQALTRVFGSCKGKSPSCAVGSVKSMISHLIPAAGVAGIIKAALALYYKVLPPTLHCEHPDPKLHIEKTPFYINTETRPWIHGLSSPRRAGVNAFGFGGINAHAILEEFIPDNSTPALDGGPPWDSEVILVHAPSRATLVETCQQLGNMLFSSNGEAPNLQDIAYTLNCPETPITQPASCLAVVASSVQDLNRKLNHAVQRLNDPACQRINEITGVYFFERPLAREGKMAFLFPGDGSQYVNMLADLCLRLPPVRERFDLIDQAFVGHIRNVLPSQVIFPPPLPNDSETRRAQELRLAEMDFAAEAVFAGTQGIVALLTELEIRPQAVLGHSGGEIAALLAAGIIQVSNDMQLIRHIHDINSLYRELLSQGLVPVGRAIAVNAIRREAVLKILRSVGEDVHLAMDNCPNQVVVSGAESSVNQAAGHLQTAGAVCIPLPFQQPYHTTAFEKYCTHLRPFFDRLEIGPGNVTAWCAGTACPFPNGADEIRQLASRQPALPVRFRETLEAMHADGLRIFVEVGPKGTLTSFVADTLRGRPHLAIASDLAGVSGVSQLNHLLGRLAAHGVNMRLNPLYERRCARRIIWNKNTGFATEQSFNRPRQLATGLALLHLSNRHLVSTTSSEASTLTSRLPAVEKARGELIASTTSRTLVMDAYLSSMDEFLSVQQEIMQAYLGRAGPLQQGVAHRVAHTQVPAVFDSPALGRSDLEAQLLNIIAERTGYPIEMLDPDLNLEADLGIDSIKRIEVLGTLHRQTGLIGLDRMEEVSGLKTIRQILDFLNKPSTCSSSPSDSSAIPRAVSKIEPAAAGNDVVQSPEIDNQPNVFPKDQVVDGNSVTNHGLTNAHSTLLPAHVLGSTDLSATWSLIGKIESVTPDKEVVIVREFDVSDDLFLKDHALGGYVSDRDPTLTGLPLIPLTMTVEMMAEAGAVLLPGKTLIQMRNVRGLEWLGLDDGKLALRITARIIDEFQQTGESAPAAEFQIQIVAANADGVRVAEAVAVFADGYPEPPPTTEFVLSSARPSKWTAKSLYRDHMFHGPSFRGVHSIERWGENGYEATLRGLPVAGLFRTAHSPRFLADPVLLDAAGQLVGYWAAEHLSTMFNVFPFGIESLQLYASQLKDGEQVACRAQISLVGESQIHANLEVVNADGRLAMRVVGWQDLRSHFPDSFYRMCISPRGVSLSSRWTPPLAPNAPECSVRCSILETSALPPLNTHGAIWLRVLAHTILNRRERETWREIKGPGRRRVEWLLGRCCAKDAVRWLESELLPADIEIVPDQNGRPELSSALSHWSTAISIAHADGVAVALAAATPIAEGHKIAAGIDIQRIDPRREPFEELAFSHAERALLASWVAENPPHEERDREYALRVWCAKEAVAKALGCGLQGGPASILVSAFDVASETLTLHLAGVLADRLPQLRGVPLTAFTACRGDLVVATCLLQETQAKS